jgi:hypothetical protein
VTTNDVSSHPRLLASAGELPAGEDPAEDVDRDERRYDDDHVRAKGDRVQQGCLLAAARPGSGQ